MSRIGKLPVAVPAGVDVKVEAGEVMVKGPKGELRQRILADRRQTFGWTTARCWSSARATPSRIAARTV